MPEEGNVRGRATRARLLAAGWETLDDLRLEEVFRNVAAREIAARAGRSERALRHHFPDGESFAAALLAMPLPDGFFGEGADYGSVAALTEILSQLSPAETVDTVRAAARANWQEVTEEDGVRSVRRQLLLISRIGAHPELAERLRQEYYGRYLPLFGAAYEAALTAAGRKPLSPFTLEQFSAILAALSEGLLLQWMTDPERITPELVADASVAVALSLTAPVQSSRSVDDVEAEVLDGPPCVSREDRPLAGLCHDVFESGVDDVSWGVLARRCGMTAAELRRRFPTIRSVAAVSFAVHLTAIGDAAAANSGREPLRAVPDGLCELVRCARRDPVCALALVCERLEASAVGATWAFEIVPLDDLFGLDEVLAARRLVNVALALALTDGSSAPASIAEMAQGSISL